MAHLDIVRTWKDEEYRLSLSEEQHRRKKMMRFHNSRAKHPWKNVVIGMAVFFSILWGVVQGAAAGSLDFDITLRNVVIRPHVSTNIHLKVFVNGLHPCNGKVILAVHGFAHTAATWEPFAEAIFEENPAGQKVCQIVAIDLPGHGKSSPPTGMLFGDMTLGDYVTVLRNTLERLPGTGLRPQTLLGHSQGGLLIQMAQQALKSQGTDLRQAFGIQHVVLMASVAPQQIPWAFVDSGTAALLLQQFVASDSTLGTYIDIPDAAWPAVFFSNLSGAVVPGAPTPEEVAAQGFNAPEPLLGALELIGASGFVRPSVDARLFDPDAETTLQVVTYEQDTIIRPSESAQLYKYLTGDSSGAGVAEVSGQEAVHDLHMSDPNTLLKQIAGIIKLP